MRLANSTVKYFLCALLALIFSSSLGYLGANPEKAVPMAAQKVFTITGQKITDAVLTGWVVSLLLIATIRKMLRGGPQLIPTRGQAILEGVLSLLKSIMEPIVGKHMFKYVFPMLIGYFFFILINNLSGLFPGIGSIAIMDGETPRFLVRPANSDLNTTLALALVSLFGWAYFTFRYAGPRAVFHEIFGNKAEKNEISGAVYYLLFLVFFVVGFIECLSIIFRVVSLSFRLYGNAFGGENLLHHMIALSENLQNFSIIKYLSFIVPLPFYLLEFLVAIIQASVFTLLVSVYVGLISNKGEEHEAQPATI
ncbi:MAG: F0F1 ATP synthase subunit A [Puniceicoccales bacterium]|jgi:F-type H+-transporting ATPase subunit a|nr:F0F1 ATP synthase subunit A [Puniceicoccales bacterium]